MKSPGISLTETMPRYWHHLITSYTYGKGLSYDIVEVVEVSPKVNRAYAVLNLEKGPVFIFFDTYNNGKQWLAANFLFNTKANAIFPEKLLSK